MILFIVFGALKARFHYLLMKQLFPKIFGKNMFSNPFAIYTLDFQTLFWYYSPFYYTKIKVDKMDNQALRYHNKTKLYSRRMLFSVLFCFFLNMILINMPMT